MNNKPFRIDAGSIVSLVDAGGACLATDRITVDGMPVGYCYREEADFQSDSGWRFFAGDESEEYLADAGNVEIYDVNTIANYDRAILQVLDQSIGSAFVRDADDQFKPAE
ncbi:TPA: DUF2185 domain-containing protein [Stenotrophomonas maltophilia]|uniref:DUF2185 domain-containing protein n=1 Tax=Stenotrophomonas maltophilia TaxID=40324 RepID=UPI00131069D9|nr:DUF2185 domain-containing protein [Stenotrophomonas maltophilia]HDS1130509.1 DUF2185 domain-containing protein [Stenotrophomonas maltophilia]HDS1157893.1 DUF2185 domain-containing protein [Stenotrophomonas maltophilia]HDS1165700.1 DUF2185 domain-containing protein [Stenotrophomonas maltophilia]HDS1171430.1 DUF2185 domain-containing protein [Stenotrophomonas maltophilia]HDS1176642.1 DUF2185 domain-containing protein [Stenotrophomonas maltophilia]